MNEHGIKKLYYSISEVSQLTSLKPHVIRHWEDEFPELRPAKNRAGNRIYRLPHIKLIFLLKKLLFVDKFTFEGARRQLKLLSKGRENKLQLSLDELLKEDVLIEMEKDLRMLLDLLKQSNHKE
jgi:DNA-binding transcriptional MerR regulator